ncbi:MAG: STAS domain-containing protein [Actinobacteria bacterium]|nr:STAS domain-containing protein [Actinomycetota bacterium]
MTIIHSHVEQTHLGRETFALSLYGEFDLYTASDLRAELDGIRGRHGSTVFVDLAGATFVDSTTLGILADARKELAATGGSMRLVHVKGPLLGVLEQTGLDEYFDGVHAGSAGGVEIENAAAALDAA